MRFLILLPVGLVLGVVASACSGKIASETAMMDTDAGAPGTDSGVTPRPTACPATLPAQGTPCTKDALLCEYGDDYNPNCNTIVVCSTDRWASPIFFGGGATKCPSGGPVIPPNPPGCAAARSGVPEGMACTDTSLSCNYDDSLCSCGVHCSNFPIRQPDCDADAGRTTGCCDTSKVTWGCFDGPKYCTEPRPRIGAACSPDQPSCAVGPPGECGQAVIQCQNGVWNVSNAECPVSTAKAKRDITYVDEEQASGLHDELMSVRLARYRYKTGDEAGHLGFIIEDMPPGSAAVLPTRDRVDLYGYVSMTVASLQQQQKELDALKAKMGALEKENAAMKKVISRRAP